MRRRHPPQLTSFTEEQFKKALDWHRPFKHFVQKIVAVEVCSELWLSHGRWEGAEAKGGFQAKTG